MPTYMLIMRTTDRRQKAASADIDMETVINPWAPTTPR